MLRICELFGETIRNVLGVVAILLLHVMEVFSVGGGALLDVWSSKKCACCACELSVNRSVPSICFVYVFCMSESPHLRV